MQPEINTLEEGGVHDIRFLFACTIILPKTAPDVNVLHLQNVILIGIVERKETCATEKGQVVIPATLRKKFGIKKGTRIQIYEQDDHIILNPLSPEVIQARLNRLQGIVPGGPSLTKELEQERARDRKREERKIERGSRL